jgi:hypothetical protein
VSELPDDLRDLDRALRAVRFEPRASLGPEIMGRAGRGEPPRPVTHAVPRGRGVRGLAIAAALAAGLAGILLGLAALHRGGPVTIDRCCYDLDGGGPADDGIRVVGRRDAEVQRLWIYEDQDRSGGLTPGDVVRLERGGAPALAEAGTGGLVTREHCCVDFDGGGPADDGLLIIGVPPDRVLMAAIYERERLAPLGAPARFPLR